MKIKVNNRFSSRAKDGKLNFYEVGNRDVEEQIGEQAIALGYATQILENKQETK